MPEDAAPITVIIPAYNSEKLLADALRSVTRQSLAVAEIIVVDDGSSDRTPMIAEGFGVRVLRQANAGPSAARNAGIRAAAEPWIAFLDADDVWMPEKINLQWSAVQLCPDVGMVACDYSREENGQVTLPSRYAELGQSYRQISKTSVGEKISYFPRTKKEFLLANLSLTPSAMLIRRDLLISVGLFDESLRYWEDNECFLRILAQCSLALVEQPVMRRRLHGRNVSHDSLKYQLGRIAVAEKLIAYPEIYPARAGQVYAEKLLPFLVPTGRLLLDEARMSEARALFARSLKTHFDSRALALWAVTWLGPSIFKRLHLVKRFIDGQVIKRPGSAADELSAHQR
ncbi:MAG: glycosyltransferase family A protein [Pyrinomonadaceae bacterium]